MPAMLQQVSGGKTKWQWYEFMEKKAHRGRLWKMMENAQYPREMWEYFCQERARVKKFREEAEKIKASRDARSVAAGIASQRLLGASEML